MIGASFRQLRLAGESGNDFAIACVTLRRRRFSFHGTLLSEKKSDLTPARLHRVFVALACSS